MPFLLLLLSIILFVLAIVFVVNAWKQQSVAKAVTALVCSLASFGCFIYGGIEILVKAVHFITKSS